MMLAPLDQENQPERRGSGDIRPIPWASLTLIAFCGEFSNHQSHCRKHNQWLPTPEILDYLRTMTQHSLLCRLGISL